MTSFLFKKEFPFERLRLVRLTLCAVVITLLMLGPYDNYYVDTAPFLYQPQFPFLWFPNLGVHFWSLKALVLFLALCVSADYLRTLTRPLFALSYLFFSFYVTCFSTTYWITNTHLIFFAFALCFEPYKRNNSPTLAQREFASFLLAFMISYIAVLYLQAGLSKWLAGGFIWFSSGYRIWTETLLLGTPFGKWLTQWPWIFQGMSMGTFVFELMLPFLFFSRRAAPWIALTAFFFHVGTFIVMGISFWFLWAFYPALFFPWQAQQKRSVILDSF